jgi:hypothetical protein
MVGAQVSWKDDWHRTPNCTAADAEETKAISATAPAMAKSPLRSARLDNGDTILVIKSPDFDYSVMEL